MHDVKLYWKCAGWAIAKGNLGIARAHLVSMLRSFLR